VTDIVSTAQVSRNAFYELFADKQDCFLACCDAAAIVALADLDQQASQPTWRLALDKGMTVYLAWWLAHPEYAKAYLIELPAAGPQAAAQRERSYAEYRHTLDLLARRARVEEPDLPPLAPLATRLVVIGITEVVAEQVRAGAIDSVMSLHGDLLGFAELMLAGRA
jgi:AcrR family transcriptional regulator